MAHDITELTQAERARFKRLVEAARQKGIGDGAVYAVFQSYGLNALEETINKSTKGTRPMSLLDELQFSQKEVQDLARLREATRSALDEIKRQQRPAPARQKTVTVELDPSVLDEAAMRLSIPTLVWDSMKRLLPEEKLAEILDAALGATNRGSLTDMKGMTRDAFWGTFVKRGER